MIPYPYNMVDMGGIDLAEANGTVVEGLYAQIVEAVNACGDVVLYNWKFAGIEIAPQHTSILLGDPITINGAVQVTEQDLVTVPGINPEPPEPPEPPVIAPLSVTENGLYTVTPPVAGFNPVTVEVTAVEPVMYTNVESGEYAPYKLAVDSSKQVAVIGSDTYVKLNSTEVFAAVCQSSLGYKAILIACPVENHAPEDTRFSPRGTTTSTRTVGGVNYYYSWASGISGNYMQGPAKWSDITGSAWDQILSLLFNEIVQSIDVPSSAYKPDVTGFIPIPEGYDGFGPLLIV